jgi:hypothetical protein
MEETLSELPFEKSCLTTVLKKVSVFLSAYPGFIVFGMTLTTSYLEKRYFKFSPFELFKLYIAIIQILKYFTEENPEFTKGLILERNKIKKIVYFWNSSTLIIDGNEEKVISFCIENEDSILVKINMTLEELHNFIKVLKSTITFSLCLSTFQNEVIIAASNLELSSLKKLNCYDNTKVFVKTFMKNLDNSKNDEEFKLIQLIHYYYDLIILIHQLSTMTEFQEENIFAKILSAT